MDKDAVARAFDPFVSSKGAGRGLGLSAVQGIVRSHGGTINVTSAPGEGSCFEILLPGTIRTEQDTGALPAVREAAGPALTVLLIEDEDALRSAVAQMLRRQGFRILEAANGNAAISQFEFRADEIDVVLLDLTLPGISGHEVLAALRDIRPGVRAILTSAYGRDYAVAAAGGDQSVPYLRKPYQIRELVNLIRGSPCQTTLTNRALP
jgi:CheY-like chemotaxis protein